MSEDKSLIVMGDRGLQLKSIDDSLKYADQVIKSGFAPKGFNTPAAVVIGIQAGAELGLSPQQSLAQMKVINGRAAPMSRAAKGIIRNAKILKKGTGFKEWIEVDGVEVPNLEGVDPKTQSIVAFIETHRADEPDPQRTSFSWHDAKRARLTEKDTYKSYPQRMLLHRAAGFHFEDHFSDVLLGFTTAEALDDYPDDTPGAPVTPRDITPTESESAKSPEGGSPDPLLAGALTSSAPPLGEPEVIEPTPGSSSEVTAAAAVTEEEDPGNPDAAEGDPPENGFGEESEDDKLIREAEERRLAKLAAQEAAKAPEPAADAPAAENGAQAQPEEPDETIISPEQRKKLWQASMKRAQGFVSTGLLPEDVCEECAVQMLTIALKSKGYRVEEGKQTPIKVQDYRSLSSRILNAKLPEGLVSTSKEFQASAQPEDPPAEEEDDRAF